MHEMNEPVADPRAAVVRSDTAESDRTSSRNTLILALVGSGLVACVCIACMLTLIAFGAFGAWATATVSDEYRPSDAMERNRGVVIPGAGISLDLPNDMERIDAYADERHGYWWYAATDLTGVDVFVSATGTVDWAFALTEDALYDFIREIEGVSVDDGLRFGRVDPIVIDGYDGLQIDYRVQVDHDEPFYVVALLLARELDTVMLFISSDALRRGEVDAIAQQIIDSLRVMPTPASYTIPEI